MNEVAPTTLITEPGVYDIPAEIYHRDPVVTPSLSRSIAKVIVERTPCHARHKHPRLNPDWVEENKGIFDIGHAFEQMLLQDASKIVLIHAENYTKGGKVAREARDDAYNAGQTPLLDHQFVEVSAMVRAARAQLPLHEDAADAFQNGKAQQTIVWREQTSTGPIWCRLLLDWLPNERHRGTIFDDVKTTKNANPDVWWRAAIATGIEYQAAFYLRGIRAVLDIDMPRFRFVVVETEAPYALVVIELTPEMLALGEAVVHKAMELWGQCVAEDRWPAYVGKTHYMDLPAFYSQRFEDSKLREEALRSVGIDPFKAMLDWQAPLKEAS